MFPFTDNLIYPYAVKHWVQLMEESPGVIEKKHDDIAVGNDLVITDIFFIEAVRFFFISLLNNSDLHARRHKTRHYKTVIRFRLQPPPR